MLALLPADLKLTTAVTPPGQLAAAHSTRQPLLRATGYFEFFTLLELPSSSFWVFRRRILRGERRFLNFKETLALPADLKLATAVTPPGQLAAAHSTRQPLPRATSSAASSSSCDTGCSSSLV